MPSTPPYRAARIPLHPRHQDPRLPSNRQHYSSAAGHLSSPRMCRRGRCKWGRVWWRSVNGDTDTAWAVLLIFVSGSSSIYLYFFVVPPSLKVSRLVCRPSLLHFLVRSSGYYSIATTLCDLLRGTIHAAEVRKTLSY